MLLSPDECKWSETLTLTQQGMRCGFTGTCVYVWVRCIEGGCHVSLYGEEGAARLLLLNPATPPNPTSRFPWNFDLLCSSHRKTRHTDPQRQEERVCVSCFPYEHICVLSSGQWHLNFSWRSENVWITRSCSCHKLAYFPLTPRRVI